MTDFVVKNGLQIGGGSKLKSGTIAGNATLDLSSGNFFSHTPTADTTFVFSNPPAAGKAHGFALKVTGADIGASYDIANAVYDSVSFSVAGQEPFPTKIAFNNDGTKMYMVGFGNDRVYQYSLSTAFDITTASYDSVSFSVSSQATAPYGLAFNNVGTKMYVVDWISDAIYQYSLATAFDLTTASYDSVSFSVASQETEPRGLCFNADGTKFYVLGDNSTVYQYSLSSAFDLTTASYDSLSFNHSSQESNSKEIRFNADGTKAFILAAAFFPSAIYQYSLSTAFNISTATYDNVSFSVAAQESAAQGFVFSPNGAKMYVVGTNNDTVYQYTTGTGPDIATFTYPASVKFPNAVPPTAPAVGETDVLTFYTDDGGTTYYGFQAGDAMQ